MAEIKKVTKKTENPYVNLYELDTLNRKGNPGKYYVASRAKSIQTLELTTGSQHSDGVIIYSLYGENHDKVVLVRQYRYAINGYIYELPAGLVEPGEDYHTSAVREMKEETGLDLHPLPVKNLYQKPYYTEGCEGFFLQEFRFYFGSAGQYRRCNCRKTEYRIPAVAGYNR